MAIQTSKAWWAADMFEPSSVGSRYTRTVRFGGAAHSREQALQALARQFKGDESEAANLTPPRQPHTPWPDRSDDWRDDRRHDVVLYR